MIWWVTLTSTRCSNIFCPIYFNLSNRKNMETHPSHHASDSPPGNPSQVEERSEAEVRMQAIV